MPLARVGVVALFRSFPFVFCACMSPGATLRFRAVVVTCFVVVAVAVFMLHVDTARSLSWAPAVYVYFLVVAVVMHNVCGIISASAARRGAVLFIASVLCIALPATGLRGTWSVVPMLVVGWEMMLSAHSYAVDTKVGGLRPDLSDGIFFLLVNPTIVYVERGERLGPPRGDVFAVARMATGAVLMLGRSVALAVEPGVSTLGLTEPRTPGSVSAYLRFCATYAVLVLGLYCAQSGLASMQIGWMRLLGHRIPERYNRPFAARNPAEFWARWNIWMGRWARRYIYIPIGTTIMRRHGAAGPTVAALITFAGIGVLHDVGRAGTDPNAALFPSLRFTFVFAVFGITFVFWHGVGRLVQRFRRIDGASLPNAALGLSPGLRPDPKLAPASFLVPRHTRHVRGLAALAGQLAQPQSGSATRAPRILSRAMFLQLAVALAWLAIPVFRTGRLPPVLEHALAAWTHALLH